MNIFKRVINKIKRTLRKNTKAYNKESFEKELLKYDVISFDIFDTLITRKIFNPDDIFNFVENKLVGIKLKEPLIDMRKKSEAEANREKNHDVNIDEIYFSMMDLYGYTEDEINGIKGLEVSLEKEFIYPRKVMLEILSMLVKKGKKVILTSDMYLNKNIVVEL
nr:hypothetical protein [Bacilli bacterium]